MTSIRRISITTASILLLCCAAAVGAAATKNSYLTIVDCWAVDSTGKLAGPLIVEGATDFFAAGYAQIVTRSGSTQVPVTLVQLPVPHFEFHAILFGLRPGDAYTVSLRKLNGAVVKSQSRVAPALAAKCDLAG